LGEYVSAVLSGGWLGGGNVQTSYGTVQKKKAEKVRQDFEVRPEKVPTLGQSGPV